MQNPGKNESKKFSKKTLKIKMLKEKRIIVRIWQSGHFPTKDGTTEHSVGHVSIKTPKNYLSLWPKDSSIKKLASSMFKPISHEFKIDLQDDIDGEGRSPDYTFCFYTLETYKIEAKFEELRENTQGWSLIGGLVVLGSGHSCASSAWELLAAGGIGQLVSKLDEASISSTGSSWGSYFTTKWSSKASSRQIASNQPEALAASKQSLQGGFYTTAMAVSLLVKNPDAIGELLKKAKLEDKELVEKELVKVGATLKDIDYSGETESQPPKSRAFWAVATTTMTVGALAVGTKLLTDYLNTDSNSTPKP